MYLPGILVGLKITAGHFINHLLGRDKTTMQYPEEKWPMPAGYRGAPTLVRDEDGREKCVSCQLCEFVCPPRAIRIKPGEIPLDSPHAKVEKAPQAFDIDMIRCIYCGLCEEVCPEEAIFLLKDYAFRARKWCTTRRSFTNWVARCPSPSTSGTLKSRKEKRKGSRD
jgi:NADH-quinone oxidoreductase subunit I